MEAAMRRLLKAFVVILAGLYSQGANAFDLSGLSKTERAEAISFAVNNSLFTLYHEVAHLLIDKLGLPVLGREEDAADNIATWILLQKKTPDANDALVDAAHGWRLTGDSFDNIFTDDDYASGYSPERQRSLQIVCMMVGADGAAFRQVANQYDIHAARQDTCFYDYDKLDRSMREILPAEGKGTRVDVRYRDGGNRLRLAERMLRNSGIFDQVAEEVRQGYRIEGRVKFTAKSCGEANAFYDPKTVEIIFCYELMQDFIDLHAVDRSTRTTGRK